MEIKRLMEEKKLAETKFKKDQEKGSRKVEIEKENNIYGN